MTCATFEEMKRMGPSRPQTPLQEIFMASTNDIPAGTWTVDASHSEIGFVARHLMVTKVLGQFKEFEGTVKVGDDIPESQVTAVAQIASVDTGSADRDTHLKSGDFFDAEANPTMSFTSTKVT